MVETEEMKTKQKSQKYQETTELDQEKVDQGKDIYSKMMDRIKITL